jgi:hypothetical protein
MPRFVPERLRAMRKSHDVECSAKIDSFQEGRNTPWQAAKEAIHRALEYAGRSTGRDLTIDRTGGVPAFMCRDVNFQEGFRTGLARYLGEYLGSVDSNVKQVYLCREELAPEDLAGTRTVSATSHFMLIIWVIRKTAALQSLVVELDYAVTREYKNLTSSTRGVDSVLEVHFVDDEEVENRRGFAALINSIHKPATRVWAQ